MHDFKNSHSRLIILFPSVQMDSQEFIQSDIEEAHKQNYYESNYW